MFCAVVRNAACLNISIPCLLRDADVACDCYDFIWSLGYKLDDIQKEVIELKETYDGVGYEDHRCSIGDQFNADKNCTITFIVPKYMAPPVLVYYELTNFHQNHRSYYSSRDPFQLLGERATGQYASAARLNCAPLYELGGIAIHPCGLTANSMFNDIFTLTGGTDVFGEPLVLIEDGIAWESELQFSFRQVKGFRKEVCPGNGNCSAACCDGENWSCTTPALDRKDGLCYRYFYPNDATTQYLYETYPKIVSPLEGVENEHFIVWMRIAAHRDFRKLYGWIDQPIPAGTRLQFQVNLNYVVTRVQATKSLVVTTTTIFGGRNEFLALGFKFAGYFCLIAGSFFALKHWFRPRKLGDAAYLRYKEE